MRPQFWISGVPFLLKVEIHHPVTHPVSTLCAGECKSVNIGETGNLQRRLTQHRNDVNKGYAKTIALAEHCEKTGDVVYWDEAKVLTTERNLSSRLLLESLIIHSDDARHYQQNGRQSAPYLCELIATPNAQYIALFSTARAHCEQGAPKRQMAFFFFFTWSVT